MSHVEDYRRLAYIPLDDLDWVPLDILVDIDLARYDLGSSGDVVLVIMVR